MAIRKGARIWAGDTSKAGAEVVARVTCVVFLPMCTVLMVTTIDPTRLGNCHPGRRWSRRRCWKSTPASWLRPTGPSDLLSGRQRWDGVVRAVLV